LKWLKIEWAVKKVEGKTTKALEKRPKTRKASFIESLEILETFFTPPLCIYYKKGASFVGFLILRLQQGTSPVLKDSTMEGLVVDEFFYDGSFLTFGAHYLKYKAFSKD
jgi:hypothetical protein